MNYLLKILQNTTMTVEQSGSGQHKKLHASLHSRLLGFQSQSNSKSV